MAWKAKWALLLSVLLVLIAACGTGNSSNARVNLTVWTSTDTTGIKWWHTEVAAFQKKHPNIHVQVLQEDQSNDYAKYTTAITGHKAPDLMLTYSYPIIPTWAKAGYLKPMDSYLNQLGFKSSSFFPYVNKLDKFNGKTWGLVQAYDDTLFTWNKTMFSQAGLNPNDPPKTLSELYADAQKLTVVKNGTLQQAGFVPFIGEGNLSVWDALEGGRVYSNGKFNMDSPTMIKAMQLWLDYDKLLGGPNAWQSLYAKTVGSSDLVVENPSGNNAFTNKNNPFYTGRVAMALVGDWYPVVYYPTYAK
ncbi:MAG: extracellular solute-binding protein, partial [Candidatus Dormibacteraeota bacterium]|nr:extracellular solute-binding protein [Candidatus Dormibacteraeota bacterium]